MLRASAVLFVTALTALAAQISVPLPFTPVPFTLQPMIVLLGGAALGARLGATSQALYLLVGLAGLPVFAASPVLPQGAARLIGPDGRLPGQLSAGGVRRRLARRAALRSAVSHVARGDGRGAGGDLRRRAVVAGLRADGARLRPARWPRADAVPRSPTSSSCASRRACCRRCGASSAAIGSVARSSPRSGARYFPNTSRYWNGSGVFAVDQPQPGLLRVLDDDGLVDALVERVRARAEPVLAEVHDADAAGRPQRLAHVRQPSRPA